MSDKNDSGRMGDGGPATVIELTPGQIVSAAIFLLVVAVAIFLAGMFARGLTTTAANPAPESSPTPESEAGTTIPAPDPPVQTARATEEPEEEPPPSPTAEPEPPAGPEQSSPPINAQPRAEIIKPEERTAESEPPPKPAPAPTETPRPEIDVTPVEEPMPETKTAEPEPKTSEPEPTPEEEPKPEPAEPEPVAVEPATPPSEPAPKPLPELPPSTDGEFTVQVMSIGVAKRASAETFQREALENKAVQVRLVESPDGKWLRAFVGRYSNRSDADRAMEELRKAGFDGCFVKRLDE